MGRLCLWQCFLLEKPPKDSQYFDEVDERSKCHWIILEMPRLHFVLLCGPGDHGISFDQLIKGPVEWGPKDFCALTGDQLTGRVNEKFLYSSSIVRRGGLFKNL